MLMKLRWVSFKKNLPISIVGLVIGGLCLMMLVSKQKTGESDVSDISTWVIGLLFLCASAFFIIGSLSGLFQRTLKKYCEQSDNLKKVEQFYYSTDPVYGVRISKEYVLAAGVKTNFMPADDLLWVYMNTVTLPPYFKKETYIYFMPKTGKPEQYKVKKEKQGGEILDYVHRTLPWVITGYSDELAKTYRNDRQSMIQAVERVQGSGEWFVKILHS